MISNIQNHDWSNWYEREVKFALYEKKGNDFEIWINTIYRTIYSADFKTVKPYGGEGDDKCDGYLFSDKLVIQCYAPSATLKQSELINKIKDSFSGALEKWPYMKEWIFICNDFGGIPAKVIRLIEQMKIDYSKIAIAIWDANDIKDFIFKLDQNILDQLFNKPPTSETFNQLDIQDVRDMGYLIEGFFGDYKYSPKDDILPIAPSAQKINKNNLSDEAIGFFKLGQKKSGLVKNYLENLPDPDFAENIATKIRTHYNSLKKDGKNAEQIFAAMHMFFGGKRLNLPIYQACIYAYMVYFFDRCDFFED
ncbi:ABC-three component system protein [Commensalibacter oyaizuii]|uniref:ABC-three component systems C-terminal domain-containing protein n=1 Tax=Commensalibacter oyaizuii TaxID=3043873 RepID=A0ABT6Q3Q1_9PROT|nr:ABC-three component system protein [Commensalibacter sp. TBRC 16381]MDI2091645.1 hypothetical protein [Commensalibacter sp. TBRC 16381]